MRHFMIPIDEVVQRFWTTTEAGRKMLVSQLSMPRPLFFLFLSPLLARRSLGSHRHSHHTGAPS